MENFASVIRKKPRPMATNKLIQSIFLLSLVNSVPVEAQKVIYEDDNPKVKVALPDNGADGRAVVICPGGGYNHAGKPKEADDWIPFFTRQGIAVATLMYDLPNGDKDVPLGQLRRVFALLRRHASDWHIDAGKIGIMGSSAGGHLATTCATHEPVADRPAFQILFYPVVTLMSKPHRGMAQRFLGTTDEKQRAAYSNELQVDSLTSPAFIIAAADDNIINPDNSIDYYRALRAHGISATLHIYPSGRHGFGFTDAFPYKPQLLDELAAWLKTLRLSENEGKQGNADHRK